MASRQRVSKRQNKDFIYEINENDLSDEDCDESPTKIQKINSDTAETSKTANPPNLEIIRDIEEDCKITGEISQNVVETTATNKVDTSEDSEKIILEESRTEGSNMNIVSTSEGFPNTNSQEKVTHGANVIEIKESDEEDTELDGSVQIMEKTIPLMEISDDESVQVIDVTKEEGEITELSILDEENATPRKEENNSESITESSFVVVDEVNSSPIAEETEENIINISFKTEEIKKCYQSNILNFLKTFAEFDVTLGDLCISVIKKTVPKDIPDQKTPKKKHKKKKAKKELFVLDPNPSNNDSAVGVRYSSKFTIGEEKPDEDETVQKKPTAAQTCFNCGESHALKDCTIPKDYNRINLARQKYMNSRTKSTRYHVDEEQKFSHLKPGVISENLRNALGLRKNELPSYIYGMRALGYPPGWLEEARIVHSSLRMFDIDGEKVKENKEKRKRGLDPDKIVSYPGFNAPMEKGFYDDFRKYNVNPYSKNLAKDSMLKHYESICEEENDSENSDMDLDEAMETLKTVVHKIKEENTLCNSPTLTELEKKKQQLLEQLNSSKANDKIISEDNNSEKHKNANNENKNSDTPNSIITVKSTAFGTPILKSSSPYSRLPNSDNFMVGVSPVIDFENLPNSTGKYEQMSEVLNKVRSTLKNLESCKS